MNINPHLGVIKPYQPSFVYIHTHTHSEQNCDSDTKRFSSILYMKKQILKASKMYFTVHTLSDQKRGFKGNNPKLLKCWQHFVLKLEILSIGGIGFHKTLGQISWQPRN